MIEGGEQAGLLEQLVEIAPLAVGHLDRNLLVDPRVSGEENGPETAGPEVGEDLVLPDRLSQEEHGARRV